MNQMLIGYGLAGLAAVFLIGVVLYRHGKLGWLQRRVHPAELPPSLGPVFETPPAVHNVSTPFGERSVLHAAMHESCVTSYNLHPAISAVANTALQANAWRIVLDIPAEPAFFTRFFWMLRALAADASSRGGLLIVRYAPTSSRWFDADDSPFYRAVPLGELSAALRLAAERDPWPTPPLDEM